MLNEPVLGHLYLRNRLNYLPKTFCGLVFVLTRGVVDLDLVGNTDIKLNSRIMIMRITFK